MSDNLANCLNGHVIVKKLTEWRSGCVESGKCLGLITCRNDILYVWNGAEQCVDSIGVKQVLSDSGPIDCVSYIPTPSLYFDVQHISVNSTSTILALYGAGGLSILKLPDRLLTKNKSFDLTSVNLAQGVFLIENHLLRKIKWHPFSSSDCHLLALTSDEKIRMFNVLDETLVWQISLSTRTVRRTLPSKLSLGETPIDFDFSASESHNGEIVHPIYILWGNGDMYSVDTNFDEDCKFNLHGPFRIEPSTEDNYGSDASSLLVMETTPPLIIVATCNGSIYHCLLLRSGSTDYEDSKVLHVVERLELELGLLLRPDTTDIVSCPVTLEKDCNTDNQYFCLHNAGLHSVSLPLISRLNQLNTNYQFNLDSDKIQSYPKYLLCTALNSGSEICYSPLLGVAYLDLPIILVLLSSGKLIGITLINYHDFNTTVNKVIDDEIAAMERISLDRQDGFKEMIDSLLKENGISSCPLFKLPGVTTEPADWLEIVHRAIQTYRSILKTHSDVALKIQQKSTQLKTQLKRQSDEINKLIDDKTNLRSTAEQIAEKYEEINEKQTGLIKRSEKLLLKIECNRDNTLSGNEKKLMNLLEKSKTSIARLERDITAVQSFHSQLEVNNKQSEEKDIYIGDKFVSLYKHVKMLNGEISDLSQRVKVAKEIVSVCQFQE